ncbi:MAG TPA: GspH/FimT family pseudopilin [Candidatus Acidoferrales bacterium]|nr:GspH/FimT family pseudopilin [Candidatus Acidoferrales bacterium]
MKRHLKIVDKQSRRASGFGIVELLIVAAIAVIMLAIAVPSFLRSYRMYQLSDAASQVETMMKYTRLEAIRLNTPINCWSRVLPNGDYQIWTDSNKVNNIANTVPQASAKQITLNADGNMTGVAAVPGTAAIVAATGGTPLTAIAPATATMLQFDQRGAVVNPAPPYAVFLANTQNPGAGYRAVIILGSGSVQIWSSSANGGWHRTY